MDRSAIKMFAIEARRLLLTQVEARVAQFGITPTQILEPQVVTGGLMVSGMTLDAQESQQYEQLRRRLRELQRQENSLKAGVTALIDQVAYTWFNRLAALRFMEVNGYLSRRVLSSSDPKLVDPDLLRDASDIAELEDLPGFNRSVLQAWRELAQTAPNPEEFLYRRLLELQCRALAVGLPFLFDETYTALFMPGNLLNQDSIVRKLVAEIPEEDWRDTPDSENGVEIVGWLYQFYISERKDEVIGAKGKVAARDIPAATQLFTPHWIVRYMVENALGRLWLEGHPESNLRVQMPFYLDQPPHPPAPSPTRGEGGQEELVVGGMEQGILSDLPLSPEWERGLGGEGLPLVNPPHPLTPSPTRGEGEPEYWEIPDDLREKMKVIAREFRKQPTPSEAILWAALRGHKLAGRKFRRQQPIGHFVVDFFCPAERLIVEVDGDVHNTPEQQHLDRERQEMLESLDFKFVRVTSHQVESDLPAVLNTIQHAFNPTVSTTLKLPLSPEWERGLGGEGLLLANPPHPLTPSPTRGEGEPEGISYNLPLWGEGGQDIRLPSPTRGEGLGVRGKSRFPAEPDGILPITNQTYFNNDITTRFIEFLKIAYSPDTLAENLDFIANALQLKAGETALQRIRRYFLGEFISDHIKTYKKRPIYWLFTSGKKRAFNALIYLHCYSPDTIARLRTDYVLELQLKLDKEIEQTQQQIDNATSTAAKKTATKTLKTLQDQQLELRDYQAKLQTVADRRITLDLDDGVAYNYTRFKGLVYEGSDLKMADLEAKAQWKIELLQQEKV